jgi:hypothetical protein
MLDADIFRGVGVEIKFDDPDNFLKIKETLTRIGIASRKDKKLWQSCHILHKQGRYAILHFKELFILDGKEDNFGEEDEGRRNTIVNLLEEWGLLVVIDTIQSDDPVAPLSHMKIISHKEKSEWSLETKYNIGKKKG